MSALLLDTHVLYWLWAGDTDRISATARRALDAADELSVAAITWYEMALLFDRRGRLYSGVREPEERHLGGGERIRRGARLLVRLEQHLPSAAQVPHRRRVGQGPHAGDVIGGVGELRGFPQRLRAGDVMAVIEQVAHDHHGIGARGVLCVELGERPAELRKPRRQPAPTRP